MPVRVTGGPFLDGFDTPGAAGPVRRPHQLFAVVAEPVPHAVWRRLARVHVGTLRLQLLCSGAVIVRNTRRVVFMLSGSCPCQDLFRLAVQRLAPG